LSECIEKHKYHTVSQVLKFNLKISQIGKIDTLAYMYDRSLPWFGIRTVMWNIYYDREKLFSDFIH